MRYLKLSSCAYRPDIDGIRSLAVLSVFLFHLQPSLLPGGFLGVDVFFVISGYLITGIILRENHLNKFSFLHFYARRVKRIFPALFVVLLLSALVATFLLPPDPYVTFMKSARYASGQLANFFFSRTVGYFNEGFSGQPLLHTWSLGVEEQFYLFWPLLIYFCFWLFRKTKAQKINQLEVGTMIDPAPAGSFCEASEVNGTTSQTINQKIAGVMLLLSLVSFMVCFSLAGSNYNLAFYMFYTRVFEFCFGGLISLRILPEPVKKITNGITGVIGIVLLFYSFLVIKEDYLGLSFLQFGVLLPCVGTALIIQTNWKKGIINRLLSMKMPVAIGRISYSLYLYHWPAILFWKMYSNETVISFKASLGIIVVAFVLSIISYLFVEQPARNATLPDRRTLVLASGIIVIFAVSLQNLENYETASWRITSYINEKIAPPKPYSPGCHKEEKDDVEYYQCSEASEPDRPVVALVGDSHAPNFLYSTTAWAEKRGYDVELYALPACPVLKGDIHIKSSFGKEHEVDCRRKMALFQSQIIDDPRVEIILIAHRFDLWHTGFAYSNRNSRAVTFLDNEGYPIKDQTGYYSALLSGTVDAVRKKGKEIIMLQEVPLFDGAKDCDWEPYIKKLLGKERVCDFDTAFINTWQQPSIDFINEFAAANNVAVVDPILFFDRPLYAGVNLYADSNHLNAFGTHFIAPFFGKAMDAIMATEKAKKHGQ